MSLEKGPALSPRLQSMLDKKRLTIMTGRLEKTLSKAQETKKAEAKDPKLEIVALKKAEKP